MDWTKITTYQAGVAQARAHRAINTHMTTYLRGHNLTMMQWSVLGFIRDAGKRGVRISDLAKDLDTSLAFITNTVNTLESKAMVTREEHGSDSRAKLVKVTPVYESKIDAIEQELHSRLKSWMYQLVTPHDLGVHVKVIDQIGRLAKF